MTLADLRTAVRAYLGVSDTDRAFTNTRLTRWLNDALNELRVDSPKSYFQQRATWAADSSTSRVYTLASQSPAVTALQSIIELRLDSTTGAKLREVSFEQLPAWAGLAYAVTGADEAATVTIRMANAISDMRPARPSSPGENSSASTRSNSGRVRSATRAGSRRSAVIAAEKRKGDFSGPDCFLPRS